MIKKIFSIFIMSIFLLSPSYAASQQKQVDTTITKPQNLPKYTIVSVVDGDTIKVKDGKNQEYTVRMISIDTPESVHPKKEKNTKEGIIASNFTKSILTKDLVIELEKDVSNTDKYGRMLSYVWYQEPIKDKNGKLIKTIDKMFNVKILEEGYATVVSYPPDIKYLDKFIIIQQTAQKNKKGFWNMDYNTVFANIENKAIIENVTTNKTIKQPNKTDQVSDQVGKIKGNINSKGEKIYHVPGGQFYDKTQIDTSKGERWFNTEKEALDAGWRPSKK